MARALPSPIISVFKLELASIILFIIILSPSNKFAYASDQCFKSIISFGDSIADTGNAAYLQTKPGRPRPYFMSPPYGETFFGQPTGRFSDGRLLIDFIAEELGIPFVTPFNGRRNVNMSIEGFPESINFAVSGATALNDSFFKEKGITIPMANVSLAAQLSWFKAFLTKTCRGSSDCKIFLQTSVVLMGEIGGNDYNHPLFQGISPADVRLYAPQVVKTIGLAINELIKLGAVTLIVPCNFPIGCLPAYLTYFKSTNKQDYDSSTGCINWLNKFAQYHNDLLQVELNRIQKLHPDITIIYADYYNAAMKLYRSPEKYGFTGGALKSCCGGEGLYNMNFGVHCGEPESISCEDPSLYVNWDGVHFTEAAYKWIARDLFQGLYHTRNWVN